MHSKISKTAIRVPSIAITIILILVMFLYLIVTTHSQNSNETNISKFKTTGVAFKDANWGKGCLVNKSGEIVKIETTTPLNRKEGTIELWIKPLFSLADKDLPTEHPIILSITNKKIKSPVLPPSLLIHFTKPGILVFQITILDGKNQFMLPSQPLNWQKEEEHYIAATWKKDTMKLYIDGEEIGSREFNKSLLNDILSDSGEEIYFGNNVVNRFLYSNTIIDEVRISNIARSSDEIQKSYKSDNKFNKDKNTILVESFDGPSQFAELKEDSAKRKTTPEEWGKIKKNAQFKVHIKGFETPVNVGSPVNTLGWEDSANISPDGEKLFFTYVKYDMLSALSKGEYINAGPLRGVDNCDGRSFVSVKNKNGNWQEPQIIKFCNEDENEVGPQLSFDGQRIYFSGNGKGTFGDNDIWVSEFSGGVWQKRKNLGSPPNSELPEEDPSISKEEDELYLWSKSRLPDGYDNHDIWMAKKDNGKWNKPVKLGPPINTDAIEMQPFLTWDGEWLYFSSNRDSKTGNLAIYRSRRNKNKWGNPEVVVEAIPKSGVIAVGEPTLTADSKYLYFVAAYKSNYDEYDCDIMYIKVKEK